MEEVCRYNKTGFCKYKNSCRYLHVNKICEDRNCDIRTCRKRHPKTCFFYKTYGRCKFGSYCKFKHIETNNKTYEEENERLTIRIKELENDIIGKDSKLEEIVKENDEIRMKAIGLENQIDEKKQNINDLKSEIEGKYIKIEKLKKYVDDKMTTK